MVGLSCRGGLAALDRVIVFHCDIYCKDNEGSKMPILEDDAGRVMKVQYNQKRENRRQDSLNNFIIMMISQVERSYPRPKRTPSGDIEEYEPDTKMYRFFKSLFADNLNSTIRAHRHALGEVQLVNKINLARDETFPVDQHLEKTYRKMEEKVTRDAVARNSYLKRNYQDFKHYYDEAHPRKMVRTTAPTFQTMFMDKNVLTPTPQKKNISSFSLGPSLKRPMTSKSESRQDKPAVVIATLDQAFNVFNNQVAQIFKMKTVSHQKEPESNPQKVPEKRFTMSTQRGVLRQDFSKTRRTFHPYERKDDTKRYDETDTSNLMFNSNEIIICDRRPKTNEKLMVQNNSMFRGKSSHKRILSVNISQRKSINEIERMQIQNKLMLINSGVNVNPTQSQGYRPKSKCWQNYFN